MHCQSVPGNAASKFESAIDRFVAVACAHLLVGELTPIVWVCVGLEIFCSTMFPVALGVLSHGDVRYHRTSTFAVG